MREEAEEQLRQMKELQDKKKGKPAAPVTSTRRPPPPEAGEPSMQETLKALVDAGAMTQEEYQQQMELLKKHEAEIKPLPRPPPARLPAATTPPSHISPRPPEPPSPTDSPEPAPRRRLFGGLFRKKSPREDAAEHGTTSSTTSVQPPLMPGQGRVTTTTTTTTVTTTSRLPPTTGSPRHPSAASPRPPPSSSAVGDAGLPTRGSLFNFGRKPKQKTEETVVEGSPRGADQLDDELTNPRRHPPPVDNRVKEAPGGKQKTPRSDPWSVAGEGRPLPRVAIPEYNEDNFQRETAAVLRALELSVSEAANEEDRAEDEARLQGIIAEVVARSRAEHREATEENETRLQAEIAEAVVRNLQDNSERNEEADARLQEMVREALAKSSVENNSTEERIRIYNRVRKFEENFLEKQEGRETASAEWEEDDATQPRGVNKAIWLTFGSHLEDEIVKRTMKKSLTDGSSYWDI
jgi:hypothetical protein